LGNQRSRPCRPRLCLTGPESTGKSELALQLAREYSTVPVPEFARDYAAGVQRPLTIDDVEPIARGQIAEEERLATQATGLLILDTDLISTVVYSRHYYGACLPWITEEARSRRADLYLLMDIDLPWKGDAVRDAGHDRDAMFMKFQDALKEFGAAFTIVRGEWEERLGRARDLAGGIVSP